MKQVLQYPHRNGLTLSECPSPGCKSEGIVVNNRYSLISPGTERAIIELASQSLLGKAWSRPDLVKQVIGKIRAEGLFATIDKVTARLGSPIPLGYSSCGVVSQVGAGVHNFGIGDRVACAGFGYACHAESIYVPKNLAVTLPANVSFDEGAFVALGAIALWGVRQSGAALGERVTVIGLGLLGQLTVQILKASGCQVIGADIDQQRLTETSRFNADLVVDLDDPQAVQAIRQFTDGFGSDGVIITAATKSNQPLEFAAEICRDRGRVTVVGDVSLDIPRKAFYQKEITLNLSRSYGPGRYDPSYEEYGNDYPHGYVRWTENRNMQAFLELVARGAVNVKSLITATYDIAQADDAFRLIETEKVLGVLLRYSEQRESRSVTASVTSPATTRERANVGFLGAGAFATGVLLPSLKRNRDYRLTKLYSPTPHKARHAADRFGLTPTDSEAEIYLDPNIDMVFITTPHNLHASQVMSALAAGKSVFVEKPLCLTLSELRQVADAYSQQPRTLVVGFNRRYSRCTRKIVEILATRSGPLMFNYIVNAGQVPSTHPLHADAFGGGRIIGEACHFIDLIAYLSSATVTTVRTESIGQPTGGHLADDNVVIRMTLSDGSLGTITYTALGDPSFPKETLQIFFDGSIMTLTDFRDLDLHRSGKRTRLYHGAMDKGFDAQLTHFLDQHRKGQPVTEVESLFHSTLVSILAKKSLQRGCAMIVPAEGYDSDDILEDTLH